MVDIRKVYFLLIFIGTCFSFADSTSQFDEQFERFADSPTALIYCIPCSEEYKDQICDDLIKNTMFGTYERVFPVIYEREFHVMNDGEADTDLAPISIRTDLRTGGRTDVACKSCNNEFPNLDLRRKCGELDEQVELQQPISFPDHISVDTGCRYHDNEVYHEGQCQTLLGQSNCAEGHWLIRRNNVLTCEVRRCPIGQIEFNNKCTEPSIYLCHPDDNQRFEIYSDGTAECPCVYDHVKDPSTDECHVKHSQGPCKVGWIIDKLVDSSSVCIPDICHPSRMRTFDFSGRFFRRLIDVDSLIYDRSVNRMVCAKKNYDGYCQPRRRRQEQITTAECDYGSVPSVTGPRSLRIEECRKNQKKGFDGTCNKLFIFKTRP